MKRQSGYSVISLLLFISMFAVMSKILISFHGYMTASSNLDRFVYFLARELSKEQKDKLDSSATIAFGLIGNMLPQSHFSQSTLIVKRMDNNGNVLYSKIIGGGGCRSSNKEVKSHYNYLITSITVCSVINDVLPIPLSVTKASYHR